MYNLKIMLAKINDFTQDMQKIESKCPKYAQNASNKLKMSKIHSKCKKIDLSCPE